MDLALKKILMMEMGKSTKTQRLRERVRADFKHSKQVTLNNLPELQNEKSEKTNIPTQKKQIEITEISTSTREDELALKVGFRLQPSKNAFSKVTADLYFDEHKIDSLRLRVLQGPLATDDSEFSSVLDITGISQGPHKVKVEMYELWSASEKLACTSKEATVDYVPVKREDHMINVRIIKSTTSADVTIASDKDEKLYREINEQIRRDAQSVRDKW